MEKDPESNKQICRRPCFAPFIHRTVFLYSSHGKVCLQRHEDRGEEIRLH